MTLISSPGDAVAALRRGGRALARRLLGITQAPQGELVRVADDLPRDDVFAQPLAVDVTHDGQPEVRGRSQKTAYRLDFCQL